MSRKIIEIKDFKKYYQDFLAVDIDYLDVKEHEVLALLGPNGAGKTTTLETLEGLRVATSGELWIDGLNVKTDYHKIRHLIGVQLQAQSLQPNITVSEAMDLFCSYYNVKRRDDLLVRFELDTIKDRRFDKLSTGQQRKLALALAIAHSPKVIILDEPTAGLDVMTRANFHDILKELKAEGTTIILSSHDMAEVEKLADRIAIMYKGKILTISTPEELKNTYDILKVVVKTNSHSLVSYESELLVKKELGTDDYMQLYIQNSQIHPFLNNLMTYLGDNQDEIVDISILKSTLEDRFIALTSGVNQ